MTTTTAVGGDSTCLTGGLSPTLQYNEFQYVDAAKLSDGSANPGWIAGAPSETFTFSFQYYVGSTTPTANTDVILYSYNPTTPLGPGVAINMLRGVRKIRFQVLHSCMT